MLKEFRAFMLRGNVIDLAIAVVVGAAFGAVINGLVKDLITPLIAAIVGKPAFSNLTFTLHHAQFLYGAFLNSVISFVLVAAAIFYIVVVPANALAAKLKPPQSAQAPTTKKCPECLSDIPLQARRCAFCTAPVQ